MQTLDIKEAQECLMTAGDWIRWAASRFQEAGLFFGHGTETAWDEAVNLVLTVLCLPPETNSSIWHAVLTPSERRKIAEFIKERIETRRPLAYLLHQAWFYGHSFYVDERVLIPRSPIAEWIEKRFAPWIDSDQVGHILDIGTGSGCIAIAAAWEFPDAQVDAADISQEALDVAAINVKRYQLENQVNLFQSDCFSNLPPKQYDIILTNPPYVGEDEYRELPPEYRHEPRLALHAGKEGLDVVKRILKEAKHFLSPQGILVMEVGNTDAVFAAYFSDLPCTWLDLERGGQGLCLITAKQLR